MKKMILQVLIILLLLGALSLPAQSIASAVEMTCPEHTSVSIDIKPGSYPNIIRLSSRGMVRVAVPTTQDFDASQFTPEMAHLSDASIAMMEGCTGAIAQRWSLDDENGDGRLDLVFFFKTQDLNLTLSSTAATLMAHGNYGLTTLHIVGTDLVQVKP